MARVAPGAPPCVAQICGYALQCREAERGDDTGGKAWRGFNVSTETVNFSAAELTVSLIATGLPSIVATFA